MRIYQIDPTKDARWADLVARHPRASVFHTVGWLQSLRCAYGYEPVAFTTSSPTGELHNGVVFCLVDSWLTGRRLVSLPFSDHCEPLCESAEEFDFLMRYVQTTCERQEYRYLEVRPLDEGFGQTSRRTGFLPGGAYFLHTLDLRPDVGTLFRSFHKDSVQRRIQRAQRAGLVENCGASEELLRDFYALFVATRSRHQIPPVPCDWFRNLICHDDNELEMRLAYKDGIPIAGILTLQFRDVVYYKYGCSDIRFKRYGAIPWLLWRAITAAKSRGATEFDLGRTQEDNAGLLAFKNHWVPRPKQLTYWQFPEMTSRESTNGWKLKLAKRVFSCMPERLLTITGELLYPHIG